MKHLKSILASFLVLAMFVGFSAPAMAAEIPLNEAITNTESAETADVARANDLVATYYYEGTLKEGERLTPVSISGSPKTIRYCVNGNGGNVIIRLTNRVSGNVKSFTAVADGRWGSQSYVGRMDSGIWDVYVYFVTGSGHDRVWMEFYD